MTSEPFTLDKLRKIQEEMPKPTFLASSVIFNQGKPLKFTEGGRDYLGAHPLDWKIVFETEGAPPKTLFSKPMVEDLDTNHQARNAFFTGMQRSYAEHSQKA